MFPEMRLTSVTVNLFSLFFTKPTFIEGVGYGFLLWTIVNAYDAVVLDICWFCHDPRFVFEGTEDMADEYHNYWFHIKGSLIGEGIALVICAVVGLIIQFVL